MLTFQIASSTESSGEPQGDLRSSRFDDGKRGPSKQAQPQGRKPGPSSVARRMVVASKPDRGSNRPRRKEGNGELTGFATLHPEASRRGVTARVAREYDGQREMPARR